MICPSGRAEASASASASASRGVDAIDTLPRDLQEAVAMDNKLFAQEIEDWDNEQARKSMSDPEVAVTYEQRPSMFAPFADSLAALSL